MAYDISKVDVWTRELDDKAGNLAAALEPLAKAGVAQFTRQIAVEYGPSVLPIGATVPLVWGNTGAWHYDQTPVNWTPSPDGAGGLNSQQLVIKTGGGVLQSTFLDGKLVTTLVSRLWPS